METKFNFKSQIATDKNQSERLLALGLKKETADMHWEDEAYFDDYEDWNAYVGSPKHSEHIPAWSLHRLILLCKYNDDDFGTLIPREGTYDYLIESIAYRIKEGYFNKEYLV